MNIQNLEVYAGTNNTPVLYARTAANAVQNLTGCTILWRVGFAPYDPDNDTPVFTAAGTITSAALGKFTVPIAPTDTQNMLGDYQHQAITTDGSGNLAVVTAGRFRVKPLIQSV